MVKRSWRIAAPAIIAASALMMSACGGSGSSSSSGTQTITFWDTNANAQQSVAWKQVIAAFEAANPKIKVKYTAFPIAQSQQKLDTAIASGGTPDVALLSTSLIADVAGQNALIPLDDYYAKSPLNGHISDKLVKLVKDSGPGGKIYELPQTTNAATIWYRTDWFKQKNLQPPSTWDNFYKAADALTDSGSNKFGFTIRGGAGSIAQVMDGIYAQSGISNFWGPDGKTTINDPKNVAALEKIAALYKKDTPSADVNNDYLKMTAQFDGGSIGMMQHNLGSYPDHLKGLGAGKFAGLTMPPSPSGNYNLVAGWTGGLGIFKSTKHKDAAWKFTEFTSSQQGDTIWNKVVGQIPANNDSQNEAWVQQNPVLANAIKVVSAPTTTIVSTPTYLPEYSSITKAETEPLWQKVLLGQMTSKQFLDTLAQKLNEAQTKYKARQ
jgi:multiple sugar transport system substrate-binding protein